MPKRVGSYLPILHLTDLQDLLGFLVLLIFVGKILPFNPSYFSEN